MRWILLTAAVILAAAGTVQATPYWSPEKIRAMEEAEIQPGLGSHEFLTWQGERYDYLLELQRVAAFITSLQVMDPADSNYGGLREGEHMLNVIQTDNTSELIWVLSRYRELTGDTQYDNNVQAAWVYEMNFPAYLEEGGSAASTGYYRVYNCGWAIRAEMKYREVFGDDTYLAYGGICATYLAEHSLMMVADNFYSIVNPTVLAWAAGNLYAYSMEQSNAFWRERAVRRGNKVKGWAEDDSTLLGAEKWAMSGGSVMWGVLNSYYQEYPESTQIWASAMAPYMDTYSDPGNFQNAWNGWYALGHLAAWQVLYDAGHLATHQALTDTLLFEDADDDGGVPAQPADADTMDQTWVSNYLAYMGLSPLFGTTEVAMLEPVTRSNLVLEANWPNPFNPNTNIAFDLPRAERVSLRVFDVQGRLVRTLVNGQTPEGRKIVQWNGLDNAGRPVSPGVYFCSLNTPEGAFTRKMVLTR